MNNQINEKQMVRVAQYLRMSTNLQEFSLIIVVWILQDSLFHGLGGQASHRLAYA